MLKLILNITNVVLDRAHDGVNALKFLFLLTDADHADITTSFVEGDVVDGHSLLLRNVT